MTPNSWTRRLLLLLLGGYLLVTISYSLLVPIFETPDEHFHFFTAHYFAVNGELPVVTLPPDPLLGPEPAQPPLYYILAGSLTKSWLSPEAPQQVVLNPLAWIGSTSATANINRTLFTPYELWPWTGYAAAAHLMRFLSVAFGLGTLLTVYAAARRLWPAQPGYALASVGLLAFWPQFNFIHAAVTNDSLITLLATLAIYQMLRIWQTDVTWPRTILLSITVGLAGLTKNAGVLLLFFALLLIIIKSLAAGNGADDLQKYGQLFRSAAKRRRWQCGGRYLGHLGVILLIVLLLTGWLWLRNQALYGDWTATNQFIAAAGGDRGYSLRQVLSESSGLWLSLFAVFGWFNLTAPDWVYAIWNGLVLIALCGAIGGGLSLLARHRSRGKRAFPPWRLLPTAKWVPGLLLLGWLLAVYAGLLLFMLQTEAAQGRLLFPAIMPLVVGLVAGWGAWGRRLRPFLFTLGPLAALATTIYCLVAVIRPAYALPQAVPAIPPSAIPIQETLHPGITLLALEQPGQAAQPGERVTFTLYWRAERIPEAPLELKFELFGRDFTTPLAQVHTYHGRGLFPPNYWTAGVIYADHVHIRLPAEIDAPLLAKSSSRLVDPRTDDTKGIIAGEVKVVPASWPAAGPPVATFGESIALLSASLAKTAVRPGDTVTIDLQWHARAAPQKELTTLVHLAAPGEPPLAQADGPPRGGSYPTTAWEAGETFTDSYQLTIPTDLPFGSYPVWIGLYQPVNFLREPALQNGSRLPNDQYQIGIVEIGP